MINKEFLEKVKGKYVHVDYFDKEEKEFAWEEGILDTFDLHNGSIDIISDTSFNRIVLDDIKTIYIKEK